MREPSTLRTPAAVAEKDFKPGPEVEPNEKNTPAAVTEKDFKQGQEAEHNEKTTYTSSSGRERL